MFFIYSIILTLAFVLLVPRFLFDAIFNGKYAAGFVQRLGFLPNFQQDDYPVVWVHCVSVGEANAARPLIDRLRSNYPAHRLIVSTTTNTGQKLAREIFGGQAELVFYFPFDWRFSVRRALRRFKPAVVLIMETEIWFNFVREAHKSGARVAIVNGRLSERSRKRYSYIKSFMRRVLSYLDLALMQANGDATRLMALGIRANKVKVTGNLKFDHASHSGEPALTESLRSRFGITADAPLIIAASTHAGEEKWLLEAFREVWKSAGASLPRLMIAPRHPERFSEVRELIRSTGFTWTRRSEAESTRDKTAEVILLDSIGELRAAFPLAEIVFVGGSLIPHGGQSVLEPAEAGRAIITGHYTANFTEAMAGLLDNDAIIQLPVLRASETAAALADRIGELLTDPARRTELGANAAAVMKRNRGAADKTIEHLRPLLLGENA